MAVARDISDADLDVRDRIGDAGKAARLFEARAGGRLEKAREYAARLR